MARKHNIQHSTSLTNASWVVPDGYNRYDVWARKRLDESGTLGSPVGLYSCEVPKDRRMLVSIAEIVRRSEDVCKKEDIGPGVYTVSVNAYRADQPLEDCDFDITVTGATAQEVENAWLERLAEKAAERELLVRGPTSVVSTLLQIPVPKHNMQKKDLMPQVKLARFDKIGLTFTCIPNEDPEISALTGRILQYKIPVLNVFGIRGTQLRPDDIKVPYDRIKGVVEFDFVNFLDLNDGTTPELKVGFHVFQVIANNCLEGRNSPPLQIRFWLTSKNVRAALDKLEERRKNRASLKTSETSTNQHTENSDMAKKKAAKKKLPMPGLIPERVEGKMVFQNHLPSDTCNGVIHEVRELISGRTVCAADKNRFEAQSKSRELSIYFDMLTFEDKKTLMIGRHTVKSIAFNGDGETESDPVIKEFDVIEEDLKALQGDEKPGTSARTPETSVSPAPAEQAATVPPPPTPPTDNNPDEGLLNLGQEMDAAAAEAPENVPVPQATRTPTNEVKVAKPHVGFVGLHTSIAIDPIATAFIEVVGYDYDDNKEVIPLLRFEVSKEKLVNGKFIRGHIRDILLQGKAIEAKPGGWIKIAATAIDKDGNRSEPFWKRRQLSENDIRQINAPAPGSRDEGFGARDEAPAETVTSAPTAPKPAAVVAATEVSLPAQAPKVDAEAETRVATGPASGQEAQAPKPQGLAEALNRLNEMVTRGHFDETMTSIGNGVASTVEHSSAARKGIGEVRTAVEDASGKLNAVGTDVGEIKKTVSTVESAVGAVKDEVGNISRNVAWLNKDRGAGSGSDGNGGNTVSQPAPAVRESRRNDTFAYVVLAFFALIVGCVVYTKTPTTVSAKTEPATTAMSEEARVSQMAVIEALNRQQKQLEELHAQQYQPPLLPPGAKPPVEGVEPVSRASPGGNTNHQAVEIHLHIEGQKVEQSYTAPQVQTQTQAWNPGGPVGFTRVAPTVLVPIQQEVVIVPDQIVQTYPTWGFGIGFGAGPGWHGGRQHVSRRSFSSDPCLITLPNGYRVRRQH